LSGRFPKAPKGAHPSDASDQHPSCGGKRDRGNTREAIGFGCNDAAIDEGEGVELDVPSALRVKVTSKVKTRSTERS
jgi:hypothetical protein